MSLEIFSTQARFFQYADDVIDRWFDPEARAVLRTGLPYLRQAPGLQEWIQARAQGMQTIFRANQAYARIIQGLQEQDQSIQTAGQELQNANQHRKGVDQEQVQIEEEFAKVRSGLQGRVTVVQNQVRKDGEFILLAIKHPLATQFGRNILKLMCFMQSGFDRLDCLVKKVTGSVRDRPALGWMASMIASIMGGLYAVKMTPDFGMPVGPSLEMDYRAVAAGCLRMMPRSYGITPNGIVMRESLAKVIINNPLFQAPKARSLVKEMSRETIVTVAAKGNIIEEMTPVFKMISAVSIGVGIGKLVSLVCKKAQTIVECQEELEKLNGEIAQAEEIRAKKMEWLTQRSSELSEQIQKGSQAIVCAQKQRQELESQKAKADTVLGKIQQQITGDILVRSIDQVRNIAALSLDENTKQALIAPNIMTAFDAIFLGAVHQTDILAAIAPNQDLPALVGPAED